MLHLTPDSPHRFDPLPVQTRPDWKQRQWTKYNGYGFLPSQMPCRVCGGSQGSAVHFDIRWTPPGRANGA